MSVIDEPFSLFANPRAPTGDTSPRRQARFRSAQRGIVFAATNTAQGIPLIKSTPPTTRTAIVDWSAVDTVILDMDGTILDLHYDNTVWNQLLPRAYADQHRLSLHEAEEVLYGHMRDVRGSIDFYSFEHWTAFTGLDLIALHRRATDLVTYRPGAQAFLRWLQASHRQSLIATNAHRDSLAVKFSHIDLEQEVDAVISSHDFGHPKEAAPFWSALQASHPFDRARALFVDDNEEVLAAAAAYGIANVLCVAQPDSQRPVRDVLRYPSFNDFAELQAA